MYNAYMSSETRMARPLWREGEGPKYQTGDEVSMTVVDSDGKERVVLGVVEQSQFVYGKTDYRYTLRLDDGSVIYGVKESDLSSFEPTFLVDSSDAPGGTTSSEGSLEVSDTVMPPIETWSDALSSVT